MATIADQTNRGSIANLSWHHCGETCFAAPLLTTTSESMRRCRLPAKRDHHANKNRGGNERLQRISAWQSLALSLERNPRSVMRGSIRC